MTDNNTTTSQSRRGMSAETARRALSEGKMSVGGKTVYVMTDTLSELPPVSNDDLIGKDFVIHRLCGEVTTEFGEAWIFEIGSTIQEATRSWLVGKPIGRPNDSVTGKKLRKHFDKNGIDALPLFVRLTERQSSGGMTYHNLESPQSLVDRADAAPEPQSPALPQTQQEPANFQRYDQRGESVPATRVNSDYEDLPF